MCENCHHTTITCCTGPLLCINVECGSTHVHVLKHSQIKTQHLDIDEFEVMEVLLERFVIVSIGWSHADAMHNPK